MHPDTFTHRAAHGGDLDRLVEGNIAMALETEQLSLEPDVVRKGVAAVLGDPRLGQYLVARSTDGLVAAQLLLTYEWSDWRNGNVWWIQSVYVWPEYRKQGVFRSLFDEVRARASRADVRGLRLYVDRHNVGAQAVYARLGMSTDHYLLFELMFSSG
ncbi:MAG: GNAT family N-acetyltransferase [Myxococcales bacterium]|nr:GNAT family N-acetyltransferase [Myxococcales bacterium]